MLYQAVGVSAVTGVGADELFDAVDAASEEYWRYVAPCFCVISLTFFGVPFREYKPELEKKLKEKQDKEKRRQEKHLARLEKDLRGSKGQKVVLDASSTLSDGKDAALPI